MTCIILQASLMSRQGGRSRRAASASRPGPSSSLDVPAVVEVPEGGARGGHIVVGVRGTFGFGRDGER